MDKAHLAMDGGDLHEVEEAGGGLVAASGAAAKLLQEMHECQQYESCAAASRVPGKCRFGPKAPSAALSQPHSSPAGSRPRPGRLLGADCVEKVELTLFPGS